MTKGINLLTPEKKISSWRLRLIHLSRVFSVVLLIFYCLIVLGVFSLWFRTRQRLQDTSQELSLKKQKVTELKHIESLQVLLKHHLSSLENLMVTGSLDYKGFLSYFEELSSGGVTFGAIGLSEEGEIGLSGETTTSLALANFLEEISVGKGKKLFSRVVLSSVTRQSDGSYLFNLDLSARDETEI